MSAPAEGDALSSLQNNRDSSLDSHGFIYWLRKSLSNRSNKPFQDIVTRSRFYCGRGQKFPILLTTPSAYVNGIIHCSQDFMLSCHHVSWISVEQQSVRYTSDKPNVGLYVITSPWYLRKMSSEAGGAQCCETAPHNTSPMKVSKISKYMIWSISVAIHQIFLNKTVLMRETRPWHNVS